MLELQVCGGRGHDSILQTKTLSERMARTGLTPKSLSIAPVGIERPLPYPTGEKFIPSGCQQNLPAEPDIW